VLVTPFLIEFRNTVKADSRLSHQAGTPYLYIEMLLEDSYKTQGQLLWIDRTYCNSVLFMLHFHCAHNTDCLSREYFLGIRRKSPAPPSDRKQKSKIKYRSVSFATAAG
jgi:hypothetical protein